MKQPDCGYEIMACAFRVYNELGPGFLERVYHLALCEELRHAGLEYEREKEIPVFYRGTKLNCHYRADIFVEKCILLELKSVRELCEEHHAQILNYLKATKVRVGYLLNFSNKKELQWLRFVKGY